MPKLATDSQQLLLLQQAQQLTHTDWHEFCIGADGHEVIGDPLAAAGRHLCPGQIDDTQVAHVAQLVHAQVVQCIHRCIQLPQICTNMMGYTYIYRYTDVFTKIAVREMEDPGLGGIESTASQMPGRNKK